MPTKKLINWSYPTSTNAKKAGMYKTGCYSVETSTDSNPPIFIKGFATLEEATTFADTLPYEKSQFCLTSDHWLTFTSQSYYKQFLAI